MTRQQIQLLSLSTADKAVLYPAEHDIVSISAGFEIQMINQVDIIDAIGGWTTEGVGHKYGQGHNLVVMYGWMKKLSAFRLVSSKIN